MQGGRQGDADLDRQCLLVPTHLGSDGWVDMFRAGKRPKTAVRDTHFLLATWFDSAQGPPREPRVRCRRKGVNGLITGDAVATPAPGAVPRATPALRYASHSISQGGHRAGTGLSVPR